MAISWHPYLSHSTNGLSNSNKTSTGNSFTGGPKITHATHFASTGKGYFELLVYINFGSNNWSGGVSNLARYFEGNVGDVGCGWGFRDNAKKEFNNTQTSYGLSLVTDDTLCCAVDLSTGNLWFGKNGSWFDSGDPVSQANPSFTGVSGRVFPTFSSGYTNNGVAATIRQTTSEMQYTIPSGYSAWSDISTEFVLQGRTINSIIRRDMLNGGSSQITGVVDRLGAPGRYRVRLFDQPTAKLLRETWADESGNYAFPYIAARVQRYFTVAHDHTTGDLKRGDLADFLSSELMP
jgi:hypothetical protein